jgi:hypothetical protein
MVGPSPPTALGLDWNGGSIKVSGSCCAYKKEIRNQAAKLRDFGSKSLKFFGCRDPIMTSYNKKTQSRSLHASSSSAGFRRRRFSALNTALIQMPLRSLTIILDAGPTDVNDFSDYLNV